MNVHEFQAKQLFGQFGVPVPRGREITSPEAGVVANLPRAIRSRVIRAAIYAAGAPAGSVSADHVSVVEAQIKAWSGQGAAHLPGGVKVERFSGRLSLSCH